MTHPQSDLGDRHHLPTDEGWLYLAGHKDLFGGGLVGYAEGNQYCAHKYRNCSISRHGAINVSQRGTATAKPHGKGATQYENRLAA
ncbi:MAG: hypothetical protein Q8K74_03710 [Candidatus Nitrotoga sp.]|nr:hypothetical protein [Candidatus Nitrotoga sp.]MDP1855144.1 hypothetical protein [Candidatus Nitrotoga sp.]